MCRLLCLLIVSSVLLGAVPVSAADDPLSVVQAFIDARNGGDIAAASPLMADTTASVGGPGCPVASPCVGAAAHQSELEGFAALHAQVTLVAPRVSGTTVEGRMEGRNDLTRAAGVDRTVSDLTADVQDGQITTWRVIPD